MKSMDPEIPSIQSKGNERPIETWFSGGVFLTLLWYWLFTVLQRVDYPYDLEWMEGGMLIHAWRIKQGLGIYVTPSSEFIPYIYPPLYPTILAWLSEIWTLDYWMGRGVSIMGTLLATSALMVGIRRETDSWTLTWLGGALWLSTYEDSGTFLDLTRADGLMMGLLGWSLVLVRLDKLRLAGVALWLAFLAKHNAAIIGFPIALWLWREQTIRSAWSFGLCAAVPAIFSVAWLQYQTDGLFLTYLLDVPAHHPIVGQRLLWLSELEMTTAVALPIMLLAFFCIQKLWYFAKWRGVMWVVAIIGFALMTQVQVSDFPKIMGSHRNGQIPFAVLVWVVAVGSWVMPTKWRTLLQSNEKRYQGQSYWLWMAGVLIVFSALMRGHHGGFTNVLMPGIWALCIVLPIILDVQRIHRLLVLTAFSVQSMLGLWTASDMIPTVEDRLAGDALVAELMVRPGPIWAPHSPWLPVQAGHPPTTHLIALWDIDHDSGPLVSGVDSIKEDIRTHRWGTIVSADKRLGFGLTTYYEYHQSIRPKGKTFLPKVGWKVRPSYVYRPKKQLEEQ